jgi:U3 small nucleolar RNA-associated protein 23
MRGKRSKQYRKLMHQYERSFNFRVPYQVLIDAEMIKDTFRFKMNLPLFLERTLHGQVKPSMSHTLHPASHTLDPCRMQN